MTQESPSRDLDKVIVRLPEGMRDRLKAAAADNNRSMNAEIVARLEGSFSDSEPSGGAAEIAEVVAQKTLADLFNSPEFSDLVGRIARGELTPAKIAYHQDESGGYRVLTLNHADEVLGERPATDEEVKSLIGWRGSLNKPKITS
ncbi:Arc family DNA-binding protein [Castellaniella sp.]|uniref:Arc family DNA-binding protein n=1 Tax=Castellaniella sp. TaxID=1955812 RepID=UPI002B002495|nr:Arc family DNA-binding protein [Castellaniella sp.]